MLTRQFWFSDTGVLVRALRTFAQTAIATIGVGTTNLFSADIQNVLALSGTAAVLSILMSMDRSTIVGQAPPAPAPAQQVEAAFVTPITGCGSALR